MEHTDREGKQLKDQRSQSGLSYEKPSIVYQGKLEAYAIVCNQKTVGCNGGTQST